MKRFGCDQIFNERLLRSISLKEFWKWVNIRCSYEWESVRG